MSELSIGIIGGTGKLGSALAGRWLQAGLNVSIGSRSAEKADAVAHDLSSRCKCEVKSGINSHIARQCELLVIAVPFGAQQATILEIKEFTTDKIVVDTTVPLLPPKVMRVQLPEEGSAAIRTQKMLGDKAKVVSAFHNVAAHRLACDEAIRCDVMVFGDDMASRQTIVELANLAGLRGIHAGPLVNSAAAEALTSVLIFINKHYAVDGAGIEFTGQLVMNKQ